MEYGGHNQFGSNRRFLNVHWPKINSKLNTRCFWQCLSILHHVTLLWIWPKHTTYTLSTGSPLHKEHCLIHLHLDFRLSAINCSVFTVYRKISILIEPYDLITENKDF